MPTDRHPAVHIYTLSRLVHSPAAGWEKQIAKIEAGRVKAYAYYLPMREAVVRFCSQSVDMQVSELTDYAQNRGWLIVDQYLDCGVSGSKESRPALNRLMNDARQRRFDILLVWKIDRFGRSLKHLVNSLAELENVGVAFVSLRDSLDLSSPAGRLMAQLLGAISEFERSLITERVMAGIRNARSKGRRLGRPRLEVDNGRIARLRSNGASLRAISEQLGVSLGTIHRAIHCSKNL